MTTHLTVKEDQPSNVTSSINNGAHHLHDLD